MKFQAIRGMKDILPEETGQWRMVEDLAREFFPRFGFHEVRSPILEKTELFIRGIGETTDVVEKEMYTFTDRSGDSLTMRPEATAQLCRVYVEHKLYNQPGGWKVFTMGPMFRHERPQKGRFRQFHQIDAEVMGVDEGLVDAELIGMLVAFLEACQVGRVTVRLNSLGCKECRLAYREKLVAFLKEREEGLCDECRRRLELNPLRVLDCKQPSCQAIVKDAPSSADHLCGKCESAFELVRRGLDSLKVEYNLDNRLVRGLDYYVGTTFEVVSDKLGGQDAVCGGGRYDDLIEEVGGPPQAATGFAIGIERLLLLSDLEPPPEEADLFMAMLGDQAEEMGLKISHRLRLGGLKVVLEAEGKSLKAQLRRAGKMGVRAVLILGPEEIKAGQAVLKIMEGGEQQTLDLDSLNQTLPRILHKKA